MLPERRKYAEWNPLAKPIQAPWPFRIGLVGFGLSCVLILASTNVPRFAAEVTLKVLLFLMLPSYLLLSAGAVFGFWEQRRRVPARDEPSGVEQYPAALTLRREIVYGTDDGMVSFVEGWLFFRGMNEDFAVRKEDLVLDPAIDGSFTFEFEGRAGRHRTTLRPLGKGFRKAWIEWRFDHEPSEGVPIYPPIVPLKTMDNLPMRIGVAGAVFETLMGVLSFRALPIAFVLHFSAALTILYFAVRRQVAIERLFRGLPSFRQNEKPPSIRWNGRGLDVEPEALTSRGAEDRRS